MTDTLITELRAFASSKGQLKYPPASQHLVDYTIDALEVDIPDPLQSCYTQIANGGFGPGYGLIGLEGGAGSTFGTLVGTYHQLRAEVESEGDEWPDDLLPFCYWGDTIFTCVDCMDGEISRVEDFVIIEESYSLEDFFRLWLGGKWKDLPWETL